MATTMPLAPPPPPPPGGWGRKPSSLPDFEEEEEEEQEMRFCRKCRRHTYLRKGACANPSCVGLLVFQSRVCQAVVDVHS